MSITVKSLSLLTLCLFAMIGLVGCASHDRQDQKLLGGATDHNAAVQAVRDLDEADTRPVESSVQ